MLELRSPKWRACLRALALAPILLGVMPTGTLAAPVAPRTPGGTVALSTLLAAVPGLSATAGPRPAAAASAASPSAQAAPTQAGAIVQVRAGHEVQVHARPGAAVVQILGARSDSGHTPRAFAVYRQVGGWLGVSSAALHGRLGWIAADAGALMLRPALFSVRVSLRRRTLTLSRLGRVLLRTSVVIGAPATPTPRGRFAVDDELRFTRRSPEYGRGVLALSVPPPGRDWHGWRVAIHGLNNLGRLGGTGSLSCVHVPDRALSRLLASVPVGTPVQVS